MTNKQKKYLFYLGLGLMILAVGFIGWKLFTSLGSNGLTGASTRMYARSATPHSFILVLFIPIIATITLFYGLVRTKK